MQVHLTEHAVWIYENVAPPKNQITKMGFFAEKNHIQVALTGLVFIQLSRCKVVFTCVHLYLLTANASEMGLANNPENS